MEKLSKVSEKHSTRPLLEIEKEILYLASVYSKERKQLVVALREREW